MSFCNIINFQKRGSIMSPEQEVTDEWLESINHKFSREGIPPIQRPFLALIEWSKTIGPIDLPSARATKIFDWFTRNTKPGSLDVGPIFTASFYFDACFWPVNIPLLYGFNFELHLLDYLISMPQQIKSRLRSDKNTQTQYAELFVHSFDYAYGFDELTRIYKLQPFCRELLLSGDREIRATVTLLHEQKPNTKAIESARMATEMFLKVFLASKAQLDSKGAKKIGHDLEHAIQKCLKTENNSDLQMLLSQLPCFPDINERYRASEKKLGELWAAYSAAQFTAATVPRSLSARYSRAMIRAS